MSWLCYLVTLFVDGDVLLDAGRRYTHVCVSSQGVQKKLKPQEVLHHRLGLVLDD